MFDVNIKQWRKWLENKTGWAEPDDGWVYKIEVFYGNPVKPRYAAPGISQKENNELGE